MNLPGGWGRRGRDDCGAATLSRVASVAISGFGRGRGRGKPPPRSSRRPSRAFGASWGVHGASWQRGPHFQIQGISRVLRETHFPWSVLKGKTGFRLLSSRNGQRRRRHGPKDSISFFLKKSSTFHQKSIFHRDFTVTPCRPTAALYTPNNPPYTLHPR